MVKSLQEETMSTKRSDKKKAATADQEFNTELLDELLGTAV